MNQALMTGVRLREIFGAPDYVYHSGYLRTIQTTEGILNCFGEGAKSRINVRMNQFIRERDPGYAYDMTTPEAEAAFPWLRSHWDTYGGFFARPPGGESLSDVSQRVYTFLNTLFRDRAGKKVWVVTHGGTLRAIRFILERWDYEKALHWPEGQSPKNCGVTVYNFDEMKRRLVLQEYNTVFWK
jgi:broad specificity phosphatase PhoE